MPGLPASMFLVAVVPLRHLVPMGMGQVVVIMTLIWAAVVVMVVPVVKEVKLMRLAGQFMAQPILQNRTLVLVVLVVITTPLLVVLVVVLLN